MLVRVLQLLKVRTTPGYLGKPDNDLVAYIQPRAKTEIANIVAKDGLLWGQLQNGWIAMTLPDGIESVYKVSDPVTSFESAMAFVLSVEGGLIADANDPGGVTKYGIAQRYHPDVDVRSLTLDQAVEIYKNEYWVHFDTILDQKVQLTLFDHAVNAGIAAAKVLFYRLGDLATFDQIQDFRIYFYKNLKQYSLFGQGWLSRVSLLSEYASGSSI